MATKKQTEQTTTVVHSVAEVAELIAQHKALDEQIRAMKSSMPKQSPLERVIQRQSISYPAWV